jgi:type I restriction enzyme S subunit
MSTNSLPEDWSLKSLGTIADIKNGSTPNTSTTSYWQHGDINWITPDDLSSQDKYTSSSRRRITKEGLKSTSASLLPVKSIVLSTRAPIGYLTILKKESSTNQGCKGLIPTRGIEAEYLYYLLSYNKSELLKHGAGSTFAEINLRDLANIVLPFPTADKQKRIAEVLGTIDNSIVKTQSIIKKSRELKKSLQQKLLKEGIGHTEFKVTPIGNVPLSWDVMTFKHVGINIIGLTYKPENVVTSEGTRVLRSSNIQNGNIDYKDSVFVNSQIPENLFVRKGDILLCTRNGSRRLIGKAAFIDERHEGDTFGAFMSVFRSKYPKFMFHFIESDLFTQQVRRHLGATINQITTGSLNSFDVAVPPKDEMQQIISILDELNNRIEVNRLLKAKQETLKRGLMQDLLTGKVVA